MANPYGAWDYIHYLNEEIHKLYVIKEYKSEIYNHRYDIWPDLKSEAYIDRLMTTFVKDPQIFILAPNPKKFSLPTGSRVDRRDYMSTVSSGSNRGISRTHVSKILRTFKILDELRTSCMSILNSRPQLAQFRPKMLFIMNTVYMLPFIYLSSVVQSWTNTLADAGSDSDYSRLLQVLRIDDYVSGIHPQKWESEVKNLFDMYKDNYIYSKTTVSDQELTREWTKVRQLTKLLVIILSPQTR